MTNPPDGSNAPSDHEGDTVGPGDGTDGRIELLHRVATELSGCSTETAVYDTAIDAAADLFDIRHAVVRIRRGDRWLTISSSTTETEPSIDRVSTTDKRLTDVIERNETTIIDDLEATTDDSSSVCTTDICTPIGEVGVLQLVMAPGFDDDDVHWVELLGWIVDARLDRLTLRDEVESIEGQLYEFSDFQRDVLEKASHELRTPLTSILGYMEVLVDEDVGSLTDEQETLAQLVLRKATELDAALETLTTAFDGRIGDIGVDRNVDADGQQPIDLGSGDGSVLLVDLDEEIATLLADQLRGIGSEPMIVDDPGDLRGAIQESPPAAIVVDLFAAAGNGLEFVETVCREETREETTIVLTSVLRDAPTDMPLLGASAYLPENQEAIVSATERLLDVDRDAQVRVLLYDATGADEPRTEIPEAWEVTQVGDLEAGRAAHQDDGYDIAILRTDDLPHDERAPDVVRTLRTRRGGRRLPVVVVDRSLEGTEPRYTIGGKLFVQRPLTTADLASTLISMPASPPQEPTTDSRTTETDQ